MATVDSHMHVNFDGFSSADIIKYLDDNRIEHCWLLGWEELNPGPWEYQHLSIGDIYDAYLKYPSRIIPFYAPDPYSDDATSLLEHWFEKGIRGCGELKSTSTWDSSNIAKILSTVEKLNIPIVFHMEESGRRIRLRSSALHDKLICFSLQNKRMVFKIPQKIINSLVDAYSPLKESLGIYMFPGYMLDFASLEDVLKDYPDVNLIAHGPMFWKNISADASSHKESFPKGPVVGEGIIWRLLKDYPNFYADISAKSGFHALARDPKNARRFLSLFEDKILFGTDNKMLGQRDFLDSLKLSKRTCEKIYGENACRLIS